MPYPINGVAWSPLDLFLYRWAARGDRIGQWPVTLVTRNDRDVAGLGATVLNPFKDAHHHGSLRPPS
jgi:hypothetical protein